MTYDPTEAAGNAVILAHIVADCRDTPEDTASEEDLRAHIRTSLEAAYEAGRQHGIDQALALLELAAIGQQLGI